MSITFLSPVACSLALALSAGLAAGQPAPAREAVPPLDHYGDPLPQHALLRIGTTRLRPNVHGSGWVRAMAFTSDGKRLVTMNDYYSGAQVWDAATGRRLLSFGKPVIAGGEVCALSPDGSRAAVVEAERVCRIYDTSNGKLLATVVGDWYGVNELRFSPPQELPLRDVG